MKIKGITYSISGKWWDDMENPAEIGEQFVALLDRIEPAMPAKTVWILGDFAGVDVHAGPEAITSVNLLLADVRKDMTAFVERNDIKDEDGSTDPRNGYLLIAMGSEDGSEFGSSKSIHVVANVGSHWGNEISFEVGSHIKFPDRTSTTYPAYKGALEAMAATFPCPYVWARYYIATETKWVPSDIGMRAEQGERLQIFDGAWIAYLSPPLAAGLAPPPDLFPERTPSGGLILSAVKDHIDPSNPDHVRRAQRLQAILTQQVASPDRRGAVYPGDLPPRVGPY